MATPPLETIEAAIDQLTLAEQLRLMERLASRIRSRALGIPAVDESDLAAMAADPAIQRELQRIAEEFAPTDAGSFAKRNTPTAAPESATRAAR